MLPGRSGSLSVDSTDEKLDPMSLTPCPHLLSPPAPTPQAEIGARSSNDPIIDPIMPYLHNRIKETSRGTSCVCAFVPSGKRVPGIL